MSRPDPKYHGDDYADMDAARNRILDLEAQLAAKQRRCQRGLCGGFALASVRLDEEKRKVAEAVKVLNYYAQDAGQGSIHDKSRDLLIKWKLWPTKGKK